jgi:hypothetical protein
MIPTRGKAQERWFAANVSPTVDDVDDNDDEGFFDFNELVTESNPLSSTSSLSSPL